VNTLRVLFALVLLAGCTSAVGSGEDRPGRSSEMAQAPAPSRAPEAPGGHLSRNGWTFEVRDDQKAEPVWVGAWTTESCETLRAQFNAASRLPSRRVSGCRPLIFTAEPSGSQVWVVSSDVGFVASPAEAKCNQTVALIMRNQKSPPPPCAPVWVTLP
jgi:hypothetical protein